MSCDALHASAFASMSQRRCHRRQVPMDGGQRWVVVLTGMSRGPGDSCAAEPAQQRLAHGRKQSGIPRVSYRPAKGQTERRLPTFRCPRTGNERRPCDQLAHPPLRDSPEGAAAVLRTADPPPLPPLRRGIHDRRPCRCRVVASSGQCRSSHLRHLAARIPRRLVASARWTGSNARTSHATTAGLEPPKRAPLLPRPAWN